MNLLDYKLKEIIGSGGQGTVYSAQRKRDGREVVIKKVFKTISTTNKIPTEVKLLEKVQNIDGVIKMLDFINEKDCYYIVMEKIKDCEDLYEFLNNSGPLSEKFIRKMFHNIVKTIIKCRDNGVFHRDIKDENILVDLNTYNVKLIDFGVGCEYDYKEETNKIFEVQDFRGSPLFSPPECFKCDKYQEESLTVWTLGILLYAMLHNGKIPYNTRKEICFGKLDWVNTNLSDEVQNLIDQCLMNNQENRIRLKNILTHSWIEKKN